MKLFCRYIGGLSAGHVSYSLGRLKYIAIYRIHSAGSNIYRNISDAIDFKSNNNFHRSKLSIIFHFYFLLANQLEPPNNISQVIINQPLSCEHPWRKKSFVEPKAVLGSVKSSSWKFFNFRVSGENCRNIHFNKALRDIQISITIKVNEQVEILTAAMSIACSSTTRATGREPKPSIVEEQPT